MKKEKITCVICKGTGLMEQPPKEAIEGRKYMAKRLREAGWSIRKIAKKLGYKSHYVVQKMF
jgi:transposase